MVLESCHCLAKVPRLFLFDLDRDRRTNRVVGRAEFLRTKAHRLIEAFHPPLRRLNLGPLDHVPGQGFHVI